MNKRVKKKWVKALRSGKYKKTTGVLRKLDKNDNPSYCCLGVLCDLYAQETKKGNWEQETFRAGATSNSAVLPWQVASWAGLNSKEAVFKNEGVQYPGKYEGLTDINDQAKKKGFNYIADVIDKYL